MSGEHDAGVVLRDESAPLEATFLPHAGMLCCSMHHHGEELLTQNAGVDAYRERGKTMGIPLLYPWANRLAGFDYEIAGRRVTVPDDPGLVGRDGNGLPIHGVIGGRLAWKLTRGPEPGRQSLTAALSWSESLGAPFEVFPFRHELRYQASLASGQLEVAVTIEASDEDPVPVAFGFHPYLSPPDAPRERWLVELPAMRYLALDQRQIPVGPGQTFTQQSFALATREFDDGFDSLPQPARFALTAAGRRIELEFLEGYPCGQVFAPPARSLICFEPMTAPANALRSGIGLHMLAAGESVNARFALRVRERGV